MLATDIDRSRVEKAQARFGIEPIRPDQIFSQECDFFVPCALGGVLNDESVPALTARVICGGANNQLLEPRHANDLAARGTLYAPDCVVKSGGSTSRTKWAAHTARKRHAERPDRPTTR
jgi:leucine dehydrogenase